MQHTESVGNLKSDKGNRSRKLVSLRTPNGQWSRHGPCARVQLCQQQSTVYFASLLPLSFMKLITWWMVRLDLALIFIIRWLDASLETLRISCYSAWRLTTTISPGSI